MKGHGNPFSVTVDALVGPRFPPIMGRCRHYDSHSLRALRTKQYPGVSKDCLVRLVMLHRHDEFPPLGKTMRGNRLGPIADSRLYKIAHRCRPRRHSGSLFSRLRSEDKLGLSDRRGTSPLPDVRALLSTSVPGRTSRRRLTEQ
jgi:hypothetical protein